MCLLLGDEKDKMLGPSGPAYKHVSVNIIMTSTH